VVRQPSLCKWSIVRGALMLEFQGSRTNTGFLVSSLKTGNRYSVGIAALAALFYE
jgi:hypothetical protein